jgi:hypothetical protein
MEKVKCFCGWIYEIEKDWVSWVKCPNCDFPYKNIEWRKKREKKMEDLQSLIKRMEWSGLDYEEQKCCPICYGAERIGHREGCRVEELLGDEPRE